MTSSRILAALGLASVLVGTSLGDTARSTPKPAKPDADMAAVLDALARLGGKPIETLTPDEARKEPTPTDAVKAVLRARHRSASDPVDEVEDRTYKGANGTEIPLRIYTPIGNGPLPVILYFHGGGWVIGDLDLYDATPRALANRTGAIVVSATYRQAPEHRFPAAHDDAFEAYRWVLANTTLIHGDLTRIAIAGEGAGGNLALDTVIRAREEKLPLPAYMVLVYPIAGADPTTPSYVANANARPLDKPMMAWFFEHTFADPADARDKRIDLVSRTDLAGLPPATVITAEIDPLRSEGRQLAKNLAAAGVAVDAVDYHGVTHGFFGMGAVVAKARRAEDLVADDLRIAWKPPRR